MVVEGDRQDTNTEVIDTKPESDKSHGETEMVRTLRHGRGVRGGHLTRGAQGRFNANATLQ